MKLNNILEFEGVKLFKRNVFKSEIGEFLNIYEDEFRDKEFIQDSISINYEIGTIRGLHLQLGDFAQGKLVTCIAGSIVDFFVDLRKDSKNFCKYSSINLDSSAPASLWLPRGFAHGYITLEKNTIVSYKLDNFYKPEFERTIIWNDNSLKIEWPKMKNYYLSNKDKKGKSINDIMEELI